MNRDLALDMRNDLQTIIQSFEKFLFNEILQGDKKVEAVEALATKDVIRSVGMSEVSKNRVDTILSRMDDPIRDVNADAPVGESVQSLAAEAGVIGSAAQPAIEREGSRSNVSLFRNLKDCIPCNQNWSWGDFDWRRLQDILTLDIRARFKWILDIEDLISGNDVLERLCGFLHAFKDLCPQDLLVLIAMLIAYLAKTIDSIKFNFEGILKDLLAMVLRPYISGLEDFLNAYIQFLVDQIDCILNLIQVSSEQLRDLSISNNLGPDSIHFKEDIITGKGDDFFNDVAEGTKRTREFLRHDTKKYVHKLTDDIPTYLVGLTRDVLDWVEFQTLRAQDAVVDFLGGEWLVTGQNLRFIDQMKSVSTIIQLLKVIYSLGLGKTDDLCSEDNIKRVIDGVNRSQPDRIVIPDERQAGDSFAPQGVLPVGASTDNRRGGSISVDSNAQAREGRISPEVQIGFSLSTCLKKPDDISEAMLRQWIEELS